ncbi:MAG TPA: M20/M25/M40 family metallo-hydrolase [Acidobacteriaceae bacterium]|nr:M20/M25/M40 family metallo-hydrolase [Acidobacteriaceae bacterium]
MATTATPPAFARVSQLASDRRVHKAFQWMHLHERQIMRWQTDLVTIPAPPFGEGPRAERLCALFRDLGLGDIHTDTIGNAIGVRKSATPSEHAVLISAHIDTVFPAGTPIKPKTRNTRLEAPGACDNGAGVACLLALAAALQHADFTPACDIIFCGNVGEEGEGNLRGMRCLYEQPGFAARIAAHLVIDGAGNEIAVTEALGSRRFQVTLNGPGGHSWANADRPNPIVVLSHAIARLSEVELSHSPRTTMNVGTIEGGTATNVIPSSASARFDFRSTSPEQLIRLEVELHRAVEDAVIAANKSAPDAALTGTALNYTISSIGARPAGALPADSSLYQLLRAVDRHFSIVTQTRTASTDANVPLSLGVPALSIGAGGNGGGIHTLNEWYDARDRESGLRRVLLLMLAAAESAAAS